ncbi:putative lipoprotein [Buttiauxella noackiae ATCC 51607]|uniref:Putative lipoprotein n=1 Tax=Buttiauxella noackiae ATCC 51607 TaxID=1354255 RepID=A0A1B7HMV6_9ENTR|nr:lysozyme inhibitor LprI family protein [Buttiauxella noackiae]OAT16891.1 putative lipoprotein [Buttiauxella noackiae ATCC 51607]
MKKLTLIALALLPLASFAAPPQAFNFSCGKTGGVYSDGNGGVWVDGQKATIKQSSPTYWEATSGKTVISIARSTEGNPEISFTGPNRTHGVCLAEDEVSFAPTAQKTTSAKSGPSFSCAAVTKDSMEDLICQSSTLSAMDLKLTETYKQALVKSHNNSTLKAEQRGWIKGRNECWKEDDKNACLANSYQQRLSELQSKYDIKE